MSELADGQSVVVGASADCDVVIGVASVSGTHLRITRVGGEYVIEDLNSTNGTSIDGFRVAEGKAGLDSRIGLGSHEVVLRQLLTLYGATPSPAVRAGIGAPPTSQHTGPAITPATLSTKPAREIEVGDKMLIIGRHSDCDVVVPEPSVSGRHARVFRNCRRIIIEDPGSRNGVHVQAGGKGDWVTYRSAVLRPDDNVRIGTQILRFKKEPSAAGQADGARLDVRDLGVTVADFDTGLPLRLLNDIHFSALKGDVVGILGPSGSGKTTLLNVLAGFQKPNAGEVLLNGESIFATDGSIAPGMGTLIGHAPQFDVVHPRLTVDQAVRYSARLRSPATWSGTDIDGRVTQAIEDVALLDKRGDRVGSHTSGKTLSGGQRKRVNIAMELVNDPKLLLLDEPTSGLSSHDTGDLMLLLRKLADAGNTVVLTIHQPSYSAFVLMDKVLILEEGGYVAYFGNAAKESFEYYEVTDREPEALLERMERKPRKDEPGPWAKRFLGSEFRKRFVEGPASALDRAPPKAAPMPRVRSAAQALATLTERCMLLKLRDPFFRVLCLVVPIVVSAIFAFVMNAGVDDIDSWDKTSATAEHNYLVILTIMACFFGALSSALEIISERAILKREQRGGVGLVPYMLSKAIAYALPAALFPAFALMVLLALTGEILEGSFFAYWIVLAPAFLASAAAGLLISALLDSQEVVIVVAVFYAIIQVVFSVFVPMHVAFEEPERYQMPVMAATQADSDDDAEIQDDQDAWYRMLELASTPITARWALQGLVTQSDLCLPQGEEGTAEPDVADPAFYHRCKTQFYQDHGVQWADDSDERADRDVVALSVTINGILAALALLGAGLVLARKP